MILMWMNGGLGNQLFQYALGRRLALDRGVTLRLDIRIYETDRLRYYELGDYAIAASPASSHDIARFSEDHPIAAARRAVEARLPLSFRHVVQERRVGFDRSILNVPRHCYLEGYWQSAHYFAPITDRLRQELKPTYPFTAETKAYAAHMAETCAVSLHLRRGDYAHDTHIRAIYGLVSMAYYRHAAARLVARFPKVHFFVFSDDPQWAAAHFQLAYPFSIIYRREPVRASEDLWLMSRAQHHIIANSTFSWWGAWLGIHRDQTVVAPRRWSQDGSLDTPDRMPPGWLTL